MRASIPTLFLAALCAQPLAAQGEAPHELPHGLLAKAWDHFHDYADLVDLMRAFEKQWPDYVSLESLGKSHEGRTLWCLVVNNRATGAAKTKPAMYVDGNIHGNEVQGAEAALYTAWYMLKNAPSVAKLRELRDRVVLYVVPTVNPDGRAWWFDEANTASSSRGGQVPTDNDGDGLYDEDGPDDLDGDGQLCRMRKKVPGRGTHRVDPKDPRVLVRCERGEKGDWILLGTEGIDDDGDGRVNEDGPGGYDPNRDWGSDWQPGYVQYGARERPFALPESRAVRDFFVAHPNIAGVQAFHNAGGMILRGPGAKDVEYAAGDTAAYDAIGKKGEEILPFYRYMIIWKDLYTVHGGFIDWTYLGEGIVSFSNELWTNKRLRPDAKSASGAANRFNFTERNRKQLEWEDAQSFGAHFVPWHEVEHPTYGKIEVGGFTKDTGRVPPGFLIREMLHRNAAFVLHQASELPLLSVADTRVTPAGEGLSYVTVEIENEHVTPTRTAQAAAKKIGRPDILHAKGEGVRILSAGFAGDRFRLERVRLVGNEVDPTRIPLEAGIGSSAARGAGFSRRRRRGPAPARTGPTLRLRYLVSGEGKIRFRYEAEKARDLEFEVEVGG